MNGEIKLARTIVAAFCLAIITSAASCGPVAKYSDELISTVSVLIHGTGDDAVRYLDAAALDEAAIARFQAAALIWGGRVKKIADDRIPRYFAVPDDQAAARSFIVGTACDAFKKQQENILPLVTDEQMKKIVSDNRAKSRRPLIFGKVEFVQDVVNEIHDALADGDVTRAFPGLTRAVICDRLG